MSLAQVAIEEATEKYSELSLFAKQQAGPVLEPLLVAVAALAQSVEVLERERDGKN